MSDGRYSSRLEDRLLTTGNITMSNDNEEREGGWGGGGEGE